MACTLCSPRSRFTTVASQVFGGFTAQATVMLGVQRALLVAYRLPEHCERHYAAFCMSFPFAPESEWYKQQTETLSETLGDLMSDDNPALAAKSISDAIQGWEEYHETELAKWKRLRALLGLEVDK